MPISPTELAANRTPPPPADIVTEADEAAYGLIGPYVDAQLQVVAVDSIGAYPVVIPAFEATVLLAHPTLRDRLVDAYSAVGWRTLQAAGQDDGSFLLTLVPPTGRAAPAPL